MKKVLIILGLLLITSPCLAGGVGYINYEKVAHSYTFAKNSIQEVEMKGREIENYLKIKEAEFNRLETPLQKKQFQETVQAEMQVKEKAFNEFREKKEEEVYQRIHAVAEKIRIEKQLDVLIDAKSVFSGGVDIKDELIKRLNYVK